MSSFSVHTVQPPVNLNYPQRPATRRSRRSLIACVRASPVSLIGFGKAATAVLRYRSSGRSWFTTAKESMAVQRVLK
jgi:hypothetical protein